MGFPVFMETALEVSGCHWRIVVDLVREAVKENGGNRLAAVWLVLRVALYVKIKLRPTVCR